MPRLTLQDGLKLAGAAVLAVVLIAAMVFRDDVLRASLDPRTPFQTYQPPPAPDYAFRASWALLPPQPDRPSSADPAADVFFIHPTTYNGGEEWNGPIDYPRSVRELSEVMLPNYAGPFQSVGRVFAPRYRQASLYAMVSQRDDAREARNFAYGDIRQAFHQFLDRFNAGRPFIIVGVEQGGSLAARLIRDEIANDPALARRMAAAYLIQTLVPAEGYGPGAAIPACVTRRQARCVVAFMPAPVGRAGTGQRMLRRALAWGLGDELDPLGERPALCVNPLLGARTDAPASERDNVGAANATDLEWGLRPAFLPHQVAAQCAGGLLWTSRPKSAILKAAGGWVDHLKAPGFNPFYADLEADAHTRLDVLLTTAGFRPSGSSVSSTTSAPRG